MIVRILKSIILLNFLILGGVNAEEEIPAVLVEVSVTILHQSRQNTLVAVSYKNAPHWHTYWKNPGDAGLPIKIEFSLSGLVELEWPTPTRFYEKGDMVAYGYEGEYTLFHRIPSDLLLKLEQKSITVKSHWLVCKHICIPGKIELEGVISKQQFTPENPLSFEVSNDELLRRYSELPYKTSFPSNLDIVLAKAAKDNSFVLYYNLSGIKDSAVKANINLLTPYLLDPFDFKHEKLFRDKKNNIYAKLPIEWDGEYSEPPIDFPKNGKFNKNYTMQFLFYNPLTSKMEIISKTFNSFSITAEKRLENFLLLLSPLDNQMGSPPEEITTDIKDTLESESKTVSSAKKSTNSLFYYLILAFLGGLILNVMPCVLPVISLKLFGLIKYQDLPKSVILKHNFFYTLGVLFSFAVLGITVILIKSAGESIGWGFQLQSPKFIAVMIIILFVFSLNLFGLFEFHTPGGKILGDVQVKEGILGDFFNGILATVLATPCSAPFLGTALTFAFAAQSYFIIIIFLTIGLGLASPFILTGFFPMLTSFLPKPGKWMEDFKRVLGLALIFTLIWLLYVFRAQIGDPVHAMKINIILALTFFAFYSWRNISKGKFVNLVLFLIPLTLIANLLVTDISKVEASFDQTIKSVGGNQWIPWSQEKLVEFKNAQQIVFIDFTAEWCFTCKVNEKLVLETDGFKKLVSEYDIKLLLGDWTTRDAAIGKWLEAQGLVGVPAYFIQTKTGDLISLGETITLSEIESHLR